VTKLTRRHLLSGAAALAAAGTLAGAAGPDSAPAPRAAGPKLQGVWLTTVANTDWPSRPGLSAAEQHRELTQWLDLAARLRLKAVFLQVRPAADAFWPSRYAPWSRYLTGRQGQNPGWDPLGTAVREAHARGLQLHAWCNPYRVLKGSTDPSGLAPSHPALLHPDWVLPYAGSLYFDPGNPEVRAHVAAAVTEPLAAYPLDGLHFDDYFYPYPSGGRDFPDQASYQGYLDSAPDRPLALGDWRRANTEALVREVRARVRAARPRAAFGVSPFGVWRNSSVDPAGSRTSAGVQCYDDLYADVRGWVRRGLLDYVAPQLYWPIGFAPADYAVLVDWWSRQVRGTATRLYVGEAAYKVGTPGGPAAWRDPAELGRHLAVDARHPEVAGNIWYNASALRADPLGVVRRLARSGYRAR
jgi:uncharacterized lipoprotein YddW (UPF0748 family)